MQIGTAAEQFLWTVGIEDTFVPQLATRTGRVLDEYELTQHYRFWRTDLALAAALGVRFMRYGFPWHILNPAPGVFDWSWPDEVLPYMIQELGIEPIVDFVHYGCPLWLDREFANPEYPERVAEYVQAFVERYRSLTRFYTPLNEPLITIRFCGYTGHWPPYLRGWRGYVRILMAVTEGISRSIGAIRAAQPDAIIVQAEASSSNVSDDASLQDDLQFLRRRQFLPNDLVLGRVGDAHPLLNWLLQHGAQTQTLELLRRRPQEIDIVGANFYPGMSCFKLERRNGSVLRRRYYGGTTELKRVLEAYHLHYQRPIMITEISTTGSVRRRSGWMRDSLAVVRDVRQAGFPVVGYTWWPLFSLVTWQFRRGRKPVDSYLAHMGLWDLRLSTEGVLHRATTPLVKQYADAIANAHDTVGEVSPRALV